MNTQSSEKLSAIWLALTNDTELSRYVSEEDKTYFQERVEAEGLSFLTVALPKLGKTMYAAFNAGYLPPVEGMKRVKGCPYPYFLRQAWETLFDEGGNLRWKINNGGMGVNPLTNYLYRDENDMYSSAAACIAQLTLMFYKLEMPYSEQQVKDVSTSFIANEVFLSSFSLEKTMSEDLELTSVLNQAQKFIKRLLSGFNPRDIVPCHGSGASSCKTKPWERYGKPRFVPKLDAVFDYGTWFYSGGNSLVDHVDELLSLEVHQELSARVCFVPKDSRGPRLISTEPREYMYIQQGLMTMLYKAIETYPKVRSMVSCIDQSRNRRLAWFASQTGSHATIDLKDASDLVSLELVEFLFPENWVEALKACRSNQTKLPDGTKVLLKKFAPMGSACCFPVEALVFWAISLASVARSRNVNSDELADYLFRKPRQKPKKRDIKTERLIHALEIGSEKALVHVFGDDIIVPTDCSIKVIETLESVGLKVNWSKCFTQGPFRESCGGDFFLGRNIAAVKWNHIPITEGSKDTVNYAKFRACDAMNNLICKYGRDLPYTFADLFEDWYHPIPLVPFRYKIDADTLFEGEFDDSLSPHGLNVVTTGEPRPHGLALHSIYQAIPPLYTKGGREVKTTRMHPKYQVYQVLLQCEVGVEIKIDNSDWSHVLRSLLNKGGLKGTSVVSLAKRYKYRRQWVTV